MLEGYGKDSGPTDCQPCGSAERSSSVFLGGARPEADNLPALVESLSRCGAGKEWHLKTAGGCGNGGLLAATLRMGDPHELSLRDPYRVNVLFLAGNARVAFDRPERLTAELDQSCRVSVLPSGVGASWHSRGEIEYLLVCFPTLYATAEHKLQLAYACLSEDPVLLQIGLTLRAILGRDEALDLEEACAWSTVIGNHLARHYKVASDSKGREHFRRSAARINHVIRYMEENLHRPLSVETLAAMAGMSKSRFSSAFRSATGFSPHQFLVARRIDRSKELLMSSQEPLVDIAMAAGFSSQSHMTTAFRRLTGLTPNEFRDAQRQALRLQSTLRPG